jgi:hypothetical protein
LYLRAFKKLSWVFGVTERSKGGRLVFIIVEDGTSETLITLIYRFINVNYQAIISDK